MTRAELSLWIWGTKEEDVSEELDELGGDLERSMESEEEGGGPVTITLQRIVRGTTETGGPSLGPPLTTKHPRPIGSRGNWVTIELRRMVAEWFKHPRDNLGVALKISGPGGGGSGGGGSSGGGGGGGGSGGGGGGGGGGSGNHRRNSKLVETNPEAEYAPYLEVQTQELDSRRGARIKRNVGLNCDEASQETRCCRYKLTVDFEKFGWDWIIAPKK